MNNLHAPSRAGLHAESHGFVANNFRNPSLKTEFKSSRLLGSRMMWETAEKAGLVTANLMRNMASGASPTYSEPWRDKVPLQEELNQILKFHVRAISRPGWAWTGPMSALVNTTLGYIDTFAKSLATSLAARNLIPLIDVVFVSNHGMTDTSNPEFIYVDNILGPDGMKAIAHANGWPSMGIRWEEGANVTEYLGRLERAANAREDETMPWHFADINRNAPVYGRPMLLSVEGFKAPTNGTEAKVDDESYQQESDGEG
ncbi:hypothetical protein GGG16DRAFT_115615 [Schizophyllum commune]